MKKTTLIPILFLFASCSDQPEKGSSRNADLSKDSLKISTSFIKPPIKGVNVPVEEFSFSAEQGDTLFPNSGSIILFPPNSLVDQNGNLVKGKVDVTYREFIDPVDFFVSGIPMNYEMNNTNYTFESSGMIEIKVTQLNVPVFVNPSNRPEVNLVTNNSDPEHNLYFLDTVQKKWIEKGKDLITNLKRSNNNSRKKTNLEPTAQNNTTAVKPIKASGGPVFEIEVSPGDFPELDIYRNVKFEIDKSEKKYNPKDAEIEWNDVRATKSSKEGLYLITFSTPNKKVTYLARPVFEGKDYDQAIKAFDESNKKGQRLAAKKLEEEMQQSDALEQAIQNREKENEKIRQLNMLIDARNKVIAEKNKITIDARNKVIAEKNKAEKNKITIDSSNKVIAKNKIIANNRRNKISQLAILIKENDPKVALVLKTNYSEDEIAEAKQFLKLEGKMIMDMMIFRSFQLPSFGYFNCDMPVLPGDISLTVITTNQDGSPLKLNSLSVITPGFNRVVSFSGQVIGINSKSDNAILSAIDGKCVFIGFEEFKKYDIRPNGSLTLKMSVHDGNITSPDDIRTLLGLH